MMFISYHNIRKSNWYERNWKGVQL